MRAFLTTFFAVLLAILVSGGVLYFVAEHRHNKPIGVAEAQASAEEAYARQVMKGLTPDDVIAVCGKPSSDSLRNYGDFKWRILAYPNFEANFIFKDGGWQYDFSDENGRIIPDSSMVTRPVTIKLPCQR